MSMIGCFYSVTDDDLKAVIAQPTRMRGLDGPPSPVALPSNVMRLFGAKTAPASGESSWAPTAKVESFDVDKAWQGIHFLLTGTDWEGEGPLAFVLHGGAEIEEDMGYGPPHGFTSS